jgi:prepilin-type N-terminal cleavage/methylation domain-containing protein
MHKLSFITRFLKTPGQCASSRDGFTAVELVVVIAIAAIVMSIAVVGTRNLLRHHAPEELVSELHVARMFAIRQHRPVTVTFNFNTPQCTVTWPLDGAGAGNGTRTVDLGRHGERFLFDNNPPGGAPGPDLEFIFSPLGFISTNPGGNVGGNIYLMNQNVSAAVGGIDRMYYQVQTTIAGGIILNRYDPATATWNRAN